MKNLNELLKVTETIFVKTVKTTCFLADMSDFAALNHVYDKYLCELEVVVYLG